MKSMLWVLAIVVLSFAVGIYFYPQLPDTLASHWGINGQVNGYMPKFWGLFALPLLSVALLVLFLLIPRIDPLKQNIKKFRGYFNTFVFIMMAFLFYVYLLTILWNLGLTLNISQLLSPALGVLFYYVGVLMEKAKRNWFIGLRTPWTLSSDLVWSKTNKLAGKLFKVCGVIALLGIIFPRLVIAFIIVPVLLTAAYTIVYSYFEYQKKR